MIIKVTCSTSTLIDLIVISSLPANIRLDEDVFKTSLSRRICSPQPYVFRRRLQDVFKTSWSRAICSSCQDVFKTFSRRLEDVLQKGRQDIFKTSSRRFEDVFKTSSRHLQDVFKTYHQIKLLLLTRL